MNKIIKDDRGTLQKIIFEGKEILLLFTKKGKMRGGDYHHSIQHDVIISGCMEFKFITFDGDIAEREFEFSKILYSGEHIEIMENFPHLLIAKEDTISIEWLEGESESQFYKPYRDLIKWTEKFLKKI